MTEFEVRWDGGRCYKANRRAAIRYAAALNDPTARVLQWGQGWIIWEARLA